MNRKGLISATNCSVIYLTKSVTYFPKPITWDILGEMNFVDCVIKVYEFILQSGELLS